MSCMFHVGHGRLGRVYDAAKVPMPAYVWRNYALKSTFGNNSGKELRGCLNEPHLNFPSQHLAVPSKKSLVSIVLTTPSVKFRNGVSGPSWKVRQE
jgi:hypothetical protein